MLKNVRILICIILSLTMAVGALSSCGLMPESEITEAEGQSTTVSGVFIETDVTEADTDGNIADTEHIQVTDPETVDENGETSETMGDFSEPETVVVGTSAFETDEVEAVSDSEDVNGEASEESANSETVFEAESTAEATEGDLTESPTENTSEAEDDTVTEEDTTAESATESEPVTEAVTESPNDSAITTETVTESETAGEPEGETVEQVLSRFENDYFYNYVSSQERGETYAEVYREMNAVANEFHLMGGDATEIKVSEDLSYYYFGSINFENYGISIEEASIILELYLLDHPIYYWFNIDFVYSSTTIYLCVYDEYIYSSAREEYHALVYSEIENMIGLVDPEESAYTKVLAYHDLFISLVDYAYMEDGVTPVNESWAHTIIGLFDGRGVVCEGYTDTMSLFMNYFGIENVQVHGLCDGVNHIWNLIRLDDGEWYWFDVTWDDDPKSEWGIEYQYFCVNDTDDVYRLYQDGGYELEESKTFLDLHDVNDVLDENGAFPARAEGRYDGEELTLRETFTVDGLTYALAGYRRVQLVDISIDGDVNIPETVAFGGVDYEVIAIGGIGEDGIFDASSALSGEVTSVSIPATVKYIWRNALSSSTLQSVSVDSENEGIAIAAGAFNGSYKLSEVRLCKNLLSIGEKAFGGCVKLRSLSYDGGVDEWQKIELHEDWDYGLMFFKVNCSDGSVG